MFLFTSDYFREVVLVPGGLAVYLGRFLTQFFIKPVAAAAIIALMFAVTQRLTYRTTNAFSLSFIPAFILAVYFNDANALMSTFVAVAAGLACAQIPFRNRIAAAVLAVALWFTCGSLALVFFAAGAAFSRKDWLTAVIALASGAACAFAISGVSDYPLSRLLTGIHYHRYHDTVPVLPWVAAAAFYVIVLLKTFIKREFQPAYSVFQFIAVIALAITGFATTRNAAMEELCEYITLAREENWNRIFKIASRRQPTSPVALSCLNLALAKADAMGEWMFRYLQIGPDGLFYPYRREHISPVPSSLVYWHLGLLNTSQRFTFAAEEVIPDYQKSAWSHKRLAEIYLTAGNINLARKRLEPLKYTLFYRSWALKTEKLLDSPEKIDSHPVYGAIRKLSLKEHENTYNLSDFNPSLELLVKENPKNRVAVQYLLGWCLLNGDLDSFAEYVKYDMDNIGATAWQEAYILYWSGDHDSPEGMPEFITKKTLERYMRFNNDRRYANTYWYYFFNKEVKQ